MIIKELTIFMHILSRFIGCFRKELISWDTVHGALWMFFLHIRDFRKDMVLSMWIEQKQILNSVPESEKTVSTGIRT